MPGCAPSFPSGAGGGPGCAFGGPGGGPGGQPGGGPSGFRAAVYFSVTPHSLEGAASWIGSEDGFTFAAVPEILEPGISQGTSPRVTSASAGRAMYFLTAGDDGSMDVDDVCRVIKYTGGGSSEVLVPAFPALPSPYPGISVWGLRVVPQAQVQPSGATFLLHCVANYWGTDIFGTLCSRRQLFYIDPVTGAVTEHGPGNFTGGRALAYDALATPFPVMAQQQTFATTLWTGDFLPDALDPWPEASVPSGQQGTGGPNSLGLFFGQPIYSAATLNGLLGFGLTFANTIVPEGQIYSALTSSGALEVFPGGPSGSVVDGKFKYFITYQGAVYSMYTSGLVTDPPSSPAWVMYRNDGSGAVIDCDFAATFGVVWPQAIEMGQPVVYRDRLYWPAIGSGDLYVRDQTGFWFKLTLPCLFTGASGTIVQSGFL